MGVREWLIGKLETKTKISLEEEVRRDIQRERGRYRERLQEANTELTHTKEKYYRLLEEALEVERQLSKALTQLGVFPPRYAKTLKDRESKY